MRARPKYATARDANEPDIVKALEMIGCSVVRMDVPTDLLVGYRAKNFLIEVKDPSQPRSNRKKTATQDEFFRLWRGQVRVVETAEEAIQVVTQSYGGVALSR